MGRIGRSIHLVGQSYRLLMQDKELMVLPLISGVLIAVVAISFFFGFGIDGERLAERRPEVIVPLFLLYVVTYAIGIFFQAAVVAGATERMRGGDPTVASALAAAGRRIGPILMWAVVASTVGVIINRPTDLRLDRFLRDDSPSARYRDALFFGGPVMPQVIVSLFHSDSAPQAPAFHVLKGLYLSLHPENLRRLLESSSARYRLYAGFSGWAPRQLQSEIQREGWYVLPADAETIFRKNMEGVWQELVQRAEKRPIAWTVDPRK